MIECDIVTDRFEEKVARVWLRMVPRVGELVWVVDEEVRDRIGTTAFVVKSVAHWAGTKWSPATHTGEPLHSVRLYVTTYLRKDEPPPS